MSYRSKKEDDEEEDIVSYGNEWEIGNHARVIFKVDTKQASRYFKMLIIPLVG